MKPITKSQRARAEALLREIPGILRQVKEITGMRVFQFELAASNQTAPPVIPAPSHAAGPFRESVRQDDDLLAELRRRKDAAAAWSLTTDHDPAIHHGARTEWRVTHHPRCSSRNGTLCDCEPIFRCHTGGKTFVVGHDGEMEPYIPATVSAADFAAHALDAFDPHGLHAFDDVVWDGRMLNTLGNKKVLALMIVGENDEARIIGIPGRNDLQRILDAKEAKQ